MKEENLLKEEDCKTRDLFLQILEKLNCPCEAGDGKCEFDIKFKYDDDTLYANVVNGFYDVEIWYPFWYSVDLDDDAALEGLRIAVNAYNVESSTTLFYVINDEGNKAFLHSKVSFPLLPQIPNVEDFVSDKFVRFVHDQIGFMQGFNRMKRREGMMDMLASMERNTIYVEDVESLDKRDLLEVYEHPNSYSEDVVKRVRERITKEFPYLLEGYN